MYHLKKIFLFILLMCSVYCSAAKRYWISAATSNWNSTANWSATSGGAGGSSVPSTNDTVYFNGSGLGRCDINATVNVYRLEVVAGYTDTITQNAFSVTVGAGGLRMNDGYFIGSASRLTINNSGLYCTDGEFKSTSGTLAINSGNFEITGTADFLHNNGLVSLAVAAGSVTSNINISTSSSNKSLNDFELNASTGATLSLTFGTGNVVTINDDITVAGVGVKSVGAGTLDVKGDVTVTGSGGFNGSGLLKFSGSGTQTLTGNGIVSNTSYLLSVEVNKPSDTLKLVGTISSRYGWKRTAGQFNAGTSKVCIGERGDIRFTGNFTGTNAFNKLFSVSSSNNNNEIFIDDSLSVKDSLYVSGLAYFTKGTNAGVIIPQNIVYIASSGVIASMSPSVSATLLFNHPGTQVLKSSKAAGGLSSVVIACRIVKNSTDTLRLVGHLPTRNGFDYVSGILDSDNAHLYFINRGQSVTGDFTVKKLHLSLTYGANFAIGTSATSDIIISDSLWIEGTETGVINSCKFHAQGHIVFNYSGTTNTGGGTGTIVIDGTGAQNFSGTSSLSAFKLPNIQINKSAGTLFLSGNIHVGGGLTYTSGTVDAGTSTVSISGGGSISGAITFYNLTFTGLAAGTRTLSSTLTCLNTLTFSGTLNAILNSGAIDARGNIVASNTFNNGAGGTTNIVINGTGSQNFTGGSVIGQGVLPKIEINKLSGSLNLNGVINVRNGWTYTAGSVVPNSSTVGITTTSSITGKHTLNNLALTATAASTVTINTDTLKLLGSFSVLGSSAITVNSGVLEVRGNIDVSNTSTSTLGGGTATILINGTSDQTLTGCGISGAGFLPKIVINKPSDTLFLSSVISSNQDWTYTAGTVLPGTSTLWCRGAFSLDCQGTATTMQLNDLVIGGSTSRALTGNINVRDDLTINSSSTLNNAGNYAVTLGGDWVNNGTYTPGSGTIKIDGSGYQSINKSSSALETLPAVTMLKTGGSLTLNCPLKITTTFNLIEGIIKSTTSNYLEISDNITMPDKGSDTGYVHGPVRKTGDDAFTFPLGDTTLITGAYHPLEITAPSNTTDQFEARYYANVQSLGDSVVDSLETISDCEHWVLNRLVGTSSIVPSLSWNNSTCNITNLNDLRLAAWDGAKWTNQGVGNISTTGNTGVFSAANAVTVAFPQYLTTGKIKLKGQYVSLKKKQDGGIYEVTNRKLRFKFEDEYANNNHILNIKIWNSSHSNIYPNLGTNLHTSKYGDMRFDIDLFFIGLIPYPSGIYQMEVTNEKNEVFYLKFKI